MIQKIKKDLAEYLKDNEPTKESLSDFLMSKIGLDPNQYSIGIGNSGIKFRFYTEDLYVTTLVTKDKKFDISISKKF